MSQTHKGSCFCGAVELVVTGEPVAAGFCHCSSCRSWSAAPVNAFSLWKPEFDRVHQRRGQYRRLPQDGQELPQVLQVCGGHLLTDHPLWGLTDVYAATIPTYRHEPKLHVNYAETVLRMKDGLPKMKDMPKEMGGSGDTLPE